MENTAIGINEKKSQWEEARRLWLGGLSANTGRAYAQAWASFTHSCAVEAWEVSRADVARWVQDMRDRGLSDGTIGQRVTGVGSFYRYCREEYEVMVDGKEMPLTQLNPTVGKKLRPKVARFGKARSLTDEETRAILTAIIAEQRDSSNAIQALRDYALFYGYLMTGRRNAEWRAARWGDFEEDGDVVWYRWAGKGEKGKLEVPPPVWGAVKAYLMATRRFLGMRAEDYIFRGQVAQGKPLVNAPIAGNQVGRLLKKYCKKAGLKAKEIHVHSLRHTAARMRHDEGEGIEAISRWMGHSDLEITKVYLQQVEQPRDTSWQSVSERLGIKAGEKGTITSSYRPYMRRRAK